MKSSKSTALGFHIVLLVVFAALLYMLSQRIGGAHAGILLETLPIR